MKAFNCPQCGALLRDVSIEKNIAACDYCGAKILIRPIGETKADNEQKFEISLVTRAESGKEEKEVFTRGQLTFTKPKYQANESLKEIFQNKPPRKTSYLPYLIVFSIIIAAITIFYLNFGK